MTVGEYIQELQKFDPNMPLLYTDEITSMVAEVAGPPYVIAMIETSKEGWIPKQDQKLYEEDTLGEVVREFDGVCIS